VRIPIGREGADSYLGLVRKDSKGVVVDLGVGRGMQVHDHHQESGDTKLEGNTIFFSRALLDPHGNVMRGIGRPCYNKH